MATDEARRQLYETLKAHESELLITRRFAALELEALDNRIAAVRQTLEWLEQFLERDPPASPADQTE
jgi:hypothetical protein